MVLKKMEISKFSYWVGVVEMCPQSLPSPQLASRRITSHTCEHGSLYDLCTLTNNIA